MNIKELTSWDVVTENDTTILVSSPFCMRDGGECISFYIHKNGNNFIISDEYFCVQYAEMYNINLDKKKLDGVKRRSCVNFAEFQDDGAIIAYATPETLEFALFDAAKLALGISYEIASWMPKFGEDGFKATLQTALVKSIDKDLIIPKFKTHGFTKEIEVPFAIVYETKKYLIDVISKKNKDSFKWNDVYVTHGKYSDIKMFDDKSFKRFVVFENDMNQEDTAKAQTLLTEVANTLVFSPDYNLSEIFVA